MIIKIKSIFIKIINMISLCILLTYHFKFGDITQLLKLIL